MRRDDLLIPVQQVAMLVTDHADLRSTVTGWTFEDPRIVRHGRSIGHTPSPHDIPRYDCVLRALADGWRLLGAPEAAGDEWVWWLGREVPHE